MTGQKAMGWVDEMRRQGLHDHLNVKDGMGQTPELSLGSSGQSQSALDPDMQSRMGKWAHPRIIAQIFIWVHWASWVGYY